MSEKLIFIYCVILGVIVGCLIGYFTGKKKPDGTIIIEQTEDDGEERELMKWVLDMDLDEIKKSPQIIFSVRDETSKK